MFISFKHWLNESLKPGSVFRKTDQYWLQYFLDLDQTLDVEKYLKQINSPTGDYTNKYISLSFDSDSGGIDDFGGSEIIIEFNENLIFQQEAIAVDYTPEFMKMFPSICLYITAYESEEDYNKQENTHEDFTWEEYIKTYEHEEEIVMKKIKYVPGLIKNVIFYVKPTDILLEMLNENNIRYELH